MTCNKHTEDYIFAMAFKVVGLLPQMYPHIMVQEDSEFKYISEGKRYQIDFFLTVEDWHSDIEFVPITDFIISGIEIRKNLPMNPPIKVKLYLNIENKNRTKKRRIVLDFDF
ncbi:MAG TPA: hypothetical protein VJ962_06050 [Clostridia bacterium]|nr:hypothetical protein [Clostridia bacterium]